MMRTLLYFQNDSGTVSDLGKAAQKTNPLKVLRNVGVILMLSPKVRNTSTKWRRLSRHLVHECSGFGHIQVECLNYNKSKGKAMNVTLNDESNFENLDGSPYEGGKYLAYTASIGGNHESSVIIPRNNNIEESILQSALI